MAPATGWGTIPVSSSMTIDALLIWSRNSTERPPPRKTSLISMAPVRAAAVVGPATCEPGGGESATGNASLGRRACHSTAEKPKLHREGRAKEQVKPHRQGHGGRQGGKQPHRQGRGGRGGESKITIERGRDHGSRVPHPSSLHPSILIIPQCPGVP